MKDSLQRKREVSFTSHKANTWGEKVGDVNGFWQSGFMPCISIQFTWNEFSFFLRAREKLRFLFLKKNFCEFQWNFSIASAFFRFFPDSKCNLSPIFECISSLPKCWTQKVLNESRGRMSTAINYARNAAEKSFGRKGLLFCIRVELRPCKPQLSKRNTWRSEWNKETDSRYAVNITFIRGRLICIHFNAHFLGHELCSRRYKAKEISIHEK